MNNSFEIRESTIKRIRTQLERRTEPRIHMVGLVVATGAIGFFASFSLLKLGVTSMAIRYPVAVGIGYVAFLGLVSLWLRRFRLRQRRQTEESDSIGSIDVIELPIEAMFSNAPAEVRFGGGGDFAGGGASRAWGESAVKGGSRGGAKGGGGDGSLDIGDEGGAVLIAGAVVAAVALSVALYLVWIAPGLFAELLLDAGIAAGLFRRLRRADDNHWLVTAFRHTVVPAGVVAGVLAIAGWYIQGLYPTVISIGGVIDKIVR